MANVDFGSFRDGTIGSEIADTSWNWSTATVNGHQKVHIIAGPPGTSDPADGTNNAVRLIGDDTMQFTSSDSGTPPHVRIHGIGFKAGLPAWWGRGKVIWRVIALRYPSGYTNVMDPVTDEQHGPNGAGPVNNICIFQRGGYWKHNVRGNSVVNNSYDWQQTFGPGTVSDPGIQGQVNWEHGNKLVVADEWVVFLYGMLQNYSRTGWFEAYHANPGDSGFITDVTHFTNISTCYPDPNGPFMSLYYDAAVRMPGAPVGIQNAIDYCGGKYFDNYTEALTFAKARFNIGSGGGVANTARPTVTGTAQVGNTLTGHAGTWTGSPTLTYQWQWDQGTGTWGNVNGATTLSFTESVTFGGAQVRLAEIGNGTTTVYSDPVSVLALGGGTVFRLQNPRGGGSRTNSPGSRNAGAGGI